MPYTSLFQYKILGAIVFDVAILLYPESETLAAVFADMWLCISRGSPMLVTLRLSARHSA